MVGNGTLVVILGFAMAFAFAGRYWNKEATQGVETASAYYGQANVYNVACAGANIGCDSLFVNTATTNLDLKGKLASGSYEVKVTPMVVGSGSGCVLRSIGTYSDAAADYTDEVDVVLTMRQYSQWQFYSNDENGIWWTTGDVVTGPLYTNDVLNISGKPVFNGQVRTGGGVVYDPNGNNKPKFLGGLVTGGPNNTMASVLPTANAAGPNATFTNPNTDPSSTYDLYMTFGSDASGGNVTYYTTGKHDSSYTETYQTFWGTIRTRTVTVTVTSTTPSQTVPLSTFAPNGVVAVVNGDAHVQGTLQGKLTVVSQQGNCGSSNSGNVLIDADVKYYTDPTKNASSDMLGLVADNNVRLTGTQQDVTIQGAIYAKNGSFTYQGYDKNGPYDKINLYGSVANNIRGPVGTFTTDANGNAVIKTGYHKNYVYDPRLATSAPPSFPYTGNFGIVTWHEAPPKIVYH